MKKLVFLFLLLGNAAFGEYVIVNTETNAKIPVTQDQNPGGGSGGNPVVFRAKLLSTSTDWEAVSGLLLSEYKITFSDTKTSASGWELYYLDGFPCYGQSQYVRTWVSAQDKTGSLRITCAARPNELLMAYRIAKKDSSQGTTTGILNCKVSDKLTINLGDCEKKTWAQFKKDHE